MYQHTIKTHKPTMQRVSVLVRLPSQSNSKSKRRQKTMTTDKKTNSIRDFATRTDMYRIDPRVIEIEENHNPRDYTLAENRAHLDELKASVAVNGVQHPVEIRHDKGGNRVILVDGECRVRACMELIADGIDIKTIPAVVVAGGNEKDRLYRALIANTGKPLSTWETGKAFQRLVNFGDTPEGIAKQMGYSLTFVNKALELADAPEEVKHMLSEEAVTPSLALHELRTKPVAEAIESLKTQVAAARASGKKTARKVQENRLDPKKMLDAIIKLIESTEEDVFSDEYKFVSVDIKTMRKLAEMVGFTSDEGTKKKAKKAA